MLEAEGLVPEETPSGVGEKMYVLEDSVPFPESWLHG